MPKQRRGRPGPPRRQRARRLPKARAADRFYAHEWLHNFTEATGADRQTYGNHLSDKQFREYIFIATKVRPRQGFTMVETSPVSCAVEQAGPRSAVAPAGDSAGV